MILVNIIILFENLFRVTMSDNALKNHFNVMIETNTHIKYSTI